MFSPCIYDVPVKSVSAPCSASEPCAEDVRRYALAQVPAQFQTKLPIGLAKDGRVIYGPFKSDGTLWQPCEVDVCNGVMEGSNYFYVATMFFPYTVGCFGPGNPAYSFTPSCSANPRCCTSGAISMVSSAVVALLAVAAAILAF